VTTHSKHTIVVNRVNLLDRDGLHKIVVVDGIIESIQPWTDSADSSSGQDADNTTVIDGKEQIAMSGLCDLYTRLREPGLTRKGTIASETVAALSAGFTRVLCAPDTIPAIDTVATVQLIKQRADEANGAQILPMAALTIGLAGEQLSELATLQSNGCPVAGQADMPLKNNNVLFSAMEYAASFDIPLFMTARDAELGAGGCAHAGAMATRLGLPGIPVASETVALARLLELCRETSCRLHISRVSSARAIQMIDAAKQEALPVTCDVGLHHLFFSDDQIAGYDASFRSEVPFRSIADRDALRTAVQNGIVDAICTDHAPHERDAALAPFPVTEPGLSAYHWSLPLILQLPDLLGLSMNEVFEKLSATPKRIIGLPTSGITESDIADFVLLDDNATVTPPEATLESSGMNHPLNIHTHDELGLSPMLGKVTYTMTRGRLQQI